MKKILTLLLVLAPSFASAQTVHTFGALDTQNDWTNNNSYIRLIPGHGVVAMEPPLPLPYTVYIVTDGASATDCTAGFGTFKVWCGYNGSAWIPLGGGGGGGSAVPGGTQFDVQINFPNGAFGADSGIFTEVPSTHTLSDNVLNANQQVQVGDTTNSGLLALGHTNGSSIDATFGLSLSPSFSTTNGGYKVYLPNSPGLGSLTITSLTPDANGFLPTSWTGSGGAVSYEPLDFLFSTVCSSPTTCTDLISTPLSWLGSSVFMAPPPLTNPLSAVMEVCPATRSNSSTLTLGCTFNSPFAPGDSIAMFTESVGGIGDTAVFSFADTVTNPSGTYHDSYSILNSGNGLSTPAADAVTIGMAQGGSVSVLVTQSGGLLPYGSWSLFAVHLRHVTAVDVHSYNPTTWAAPGSVTNLSAATTASAPDVILSTSQSFTGSSNVLTAGSGYAFPIGGQIHATSISGNLDNFAVEATNAIGAGAVQPTVVGTQQPSGGPAGDSFTIGFTYSGSATSGVPEPRYPTLQDEVAWGVLPDPTGHAGGVMGTTDGTSLSFITGAGTGNVTGSFTTNRVPKGTAAHTLGDSSISDDGTTVSTAEAVDLSGAASLKPPGGGGTLTLGTASINWATLGTGIVLNTTTSGAKSVIAASGVKCYPYQGSGGTGCDIPAASGANVALSNLAGVAINTSLLAASAASANLGTNLVPWGNVFIGGTANQSLSFDTSALSTNRTLTIPDHASNPVQGIANPSDTNVINYISTDGVQHRIAQAAGTVTASGSPVSGNIAKFTTATNIAPAAYTDIVALWASGSCSGYLKNDGTCSVPSGGTVTSIATTSPITGGTITTTGTIACATCTITIASGTATLGTSAISSGTCATVVTASATGTATTDNIMGDFNADPTSTTGYSPSATGMLTIIKYPTSNNVNFKVCNNTGASITPGAATLNWRVVR